VTAPAAAALVCARERTAVGRLQEAVGSLRHGPLVGGGELDALGLDLLWMVGEGVGHVLQRILLRERLEAQRAQLQRMMSAAADSMRTACTAEIAFGTPASSDTVVALRPARPPVDRRC
jgi:hypothetical protein